MGLSPTTLVAPQPRGVLDPSTGQPVQLKIGRFGPYVEVTPPDGEKPKRSSLPKGWSPADCPSEIVGDLHNECEELRSDAERYRKLRDVDAWGEDTAPGGGSAWARLGELHGSEFDAFVDSRAESAIETPAKVSPCAGHAVQQDADEAGGA